MFRNTLLVLTTTALSSSPVSDYGNVEDIVNGFAQSFHFSILDKASSKNLQMISLNYLRIKGVAALT
ncbi:MAG: hypothetical protein ACLTKE_00750 [Coprococcus sp.]